MMSIPMDTRSEGVTFNRSLLNLIKVIMDSSLNFNKQISVVVKSSLFDLRSIAKVKHLITRKNLEIVVHSLTYQGWTIVTLFTLVSR